MSHPPFPLGADIILTVFSSLACGTSMHGVASPMQPSIVYQVPLVRAYQDRNTCLKIGRTSLPPARQYHSDRLIPTLRWMLTHPLLPVDGKIRGAYPALTIHTILYSNHATSLIISYTLHVSDWRLLKILRTVVADPSDGGSPLAICLCHSSRSETAFSIISADIRTRPRSNSCRCRSSAFSFRARCMGPLVDNLPGVLR